MRVLQNDGRSRQIRYNDSTISLGSNNLVVPSDEEIYICPSLIAHYVDAHEYCPPFQFQRAIIACPQMRSITYLRLLRKHGVHKLVPA